MKKRGGGQLHQQEIFKYVKQQKKGSGRGFLHISPEDGVESPVNQNGTKEEKTGQKTERGNTRSTLPNTLSGQADTIQTEVPLAPPLRTLLSSTQPLKRDSHSASGTSEHHQGEYGKTSRKTRDWFLPLWLSCCVY